MGRKVEVLDWRTFFAGDVHKRKEPVRKVFDALAVSYAALTPLHAYAAENGGFVKLLNTVADYSDYAVWGVVGYCGLVWMFGTRTKAIAIFFDGGIGYIIVRHAHEIQQWLKSI